MYSFYFHLAQVVFSKPHMTRHRKENKYCTYRIKLNSKGLQDKS